MKDDRTYCSAIVRERLAGVECGPLRENRPRKGVLKVTTGEPYQGKPGEQPGLFVFLAVVEVSTARTTTKEWRQRRRAGSTTPS
ncbi:hypothetical protein [Streptomyces sp. NPDC056194]|uniref:hypothetical protein n=1 Tax=unclassified Streptomyces TaxID=2593676 RepID=UPI0035D64308